ncbi:hypothetical protein [Methylobacterium sp. WL6]|uniref:hypothetical protein n=1 Tax=Methylobacterium sp. WL6 TaxID=2603901 RepID=UPI0011C884FA|nr:hypothetical protein [Methylobacterium sp. WL6]TXN70474.1 hypothetical protein FV230_10485 [Methylobacterium sp. WL6]
MFHDAFVSRFVAQETGLVIEVDEFSFSSNETMPPARIVIAGARCIIRNDEIVGAFEVESGDAEINDLYPYPNGVRLVLFWHQGNPRAPAHCCGYRFPGATLHIEALSGGPLVPVRTSEPDDEGGT